MARFSGDVTLVQPNRWVRALYAVPAVLGAALVGVTAYGVATGRAGPGLGEFIPAMFMMTALSAAGTAFAVRFNLAAKRTRASIEADRDGVQSGGRLLVAQSAIVDGYVIAQTDGSILVRLLGRRRVPLLSIVVASRDAGESLLRSLELDVLHRGLDVATLVNTRGSNLPTRILVGADGVLVRFPGVGFVPYADIARVEATQTGGSIVRRSGEPIHFAAVSITSAALRERIEEGLAAFRRAEPADVAALVARGSRPAGEWLAALRAGASEREYRSADVPDEALWRVAEDPTALPSARAGAAVVLRARGGEPVRARIEAAAAVTAHPRVRVVLDAAAKGDDDALAAAIEAAADAERRSAQSP